MKAEIILDHQTTQSDATKSIQKNILSRNKTNIHYIELVKLQQT